MKEIVIISGKGGTGKTTLCASFASLARDAVIADCDVDAADLHLLLAPRVLQEADFVGGRTPVIDSELCAECGDCQAWCRFDAIELDIDAGYIIDPLACEHCALCAYVCPEEAISMQSSVSGRWFISETAQGKLVHARLAPGEDNSGKLVTLVRREARRLAEETGARWILNDGPPGVGCPVTAAITGVDLALIVTEPTLSGIHDMQRVEALCRHFQIPALVCINK
jgi:MinD superfamily P-loop ATPase